jgi:hypothetical protein
MSENWDFYFCKIDDKTRSINLDLGIADSIPIVDLPFMAYIQLNMNSPSDNGLSSQEELSALTAIEMALEDKFFADRIQYVDRCTTDSHRDFFFYISHPQDWMQSVFC